MSLGLMLHIVQLGSLNTLDALRSSSHVLGCHPSTWALLLMSKHSCMCRGAVLPVAR